MRSLRPITVLVSIFVLTLMVSVSWANFVPIFRPSPADTGKISTLMTQGVLTTISGHDSATGEVELVNIYLLHLSTDHKSDFAFWAQEAAWAFLGGDTSNLVLERPIVVDKKTIFHGPYNLGRLDGVIFLAEVSGNFRDDGKTLYAKEITVTDFFIR